MCSWPAVAKFFFTDSEPLKVCGLTMWNKPSFTMNEYLFWVFSYFQQLWYASCSYCLFYKFAIYCTTTWYELSCKKQRPPPSPRFPGSYWSPRQYTPGSCSQAGDQLVLQTRSFPFHSVNCFHVQNTGSNWWCRTERVCLDHPPVPLSTSVDTFQEN